MIDADPDAHLLGPGLLPTPFTADEIRAAAGSGKTIRILVEHPDGTRTLRVNRFRDTDADGATLERWTSGETGIVEGAISSGRVTWSELQGHAAFPSDRTTLSTETLDLPIGRVDCLRYEVRENPDAAPDTFWFSVAHPGMPVRFETTVDGGVQRTTVVAIERG
ncbi:DUF3108 domain-containing protein [Microbacterium sp. CIAB417]|uniref:DUF3108 domain-containing protein n=1 Tax=Microbacterium sp. CIAB417 TaxID=2860287 RepID=UPI001FAC52A8|nr:DUF3108 domain-containing protein [Microbacterium sp. CIAB417]